MHFYWLLPGARLRSPRSLPPLQLLLLQLLAGQLHHFFTAATIAHRYLCLGLILSVDTHRCGW